MKATHIKAIAFGSQTLIGSSGDFPRDHGNCFGLIDEDGNEYRIVNFIAENFEHLQELGLEWPVQMAVLDNTRCAALNDPRIGDRWFEKEYCEICCPKELLPLPQILRHRRMECRGERKESNGWVEVTMTANIPFP